MYTTTTNFHSDRQEYNTIKKNYKKEPFENNHFESHRDISPYQVENFIDMLHNFGISDQTIQKKLINSPHGQGFPKQEGSIESNMGSLSQIKSVNFSPNFLEKG